VSARHKTATNRAANVYDVASYSNRHTKRGNLYESKKPNFLSRKWRRTITRRVAISNQLLNQVVVVVVLLLVGRSSSEKHRAPSSQIGLRRNLAEMFIKAVRSPKRCKIGPRLLLRTNIKSHTRFRLVPTSLTLDDLERLKCPSCRNRKVLRRPPEKFEWR